MWGEYMMLAPPCLRKNTTVFTTLFPLTKNTQSAATFPQQKTCRLIGSVKKLLNRASSHLRRLKRCRRIWTGARESLPPPPPPSPHHHHVVRSMWRTNFVRLSFFVCLAVLVCIACVFLPFLCCFLSRSSSKGVSVCEPCLCFCFF